MRDITNITNITGITRKGATVGGIPDKSDAMFLLDGTIIEISGSYYFKDKTTNARNFLITGYDWSDRNIAGFPYKSAATISAPAGDAALIAADLNNYLYDSGGTPNQIPVVSLFQDVDYEHKIFTKHSGQVLDVITGVELSEPYVKEIVMYSTVRTGADLLACQVYFVVPTEDASAKWVSATGNDTTGTGTKEAPYGTYSKAMSVSTAPAQVIYLKTNKLTFATGYITINKNVRLIGIGRNEYILNSAVSYGIRNLTVSGYAERLIITLPVTCTYNIYNPVASQFKKLYFDSTNSSYGYAKDLGTESVELENVIFKGVYSNPLIYLRSSSNLTLNSCHLAPSKTSINNYNSAFTGLINVKHCLFESDSNTDPIINIGSGARYDVDIFNNRFSKLSGTGYVFLSENQNTVKFNDNIVEADNSIPIALSSSGTLTSLVEIKTNLLKGRNNYILRVGTDTTSATGNQKISGIEISRNKLVATGDTLNQHCIFVGYQLGAKIKHNKVTDSYIGAAIEGDDYDNTGSEITGNVLMNMDDAIILAGVSNNKVYNNTISIRQDKSIKIGVRIIKNTGGFVTENTDVKNNLIYSTDSFNAIWVESGCEVGLQCDYNLYYAGAGTLNFSYLGVNKTFGEWQALGFDTHSRILTTEEFNQISAAGVPSVALTGGADLGEDYDTGLDTSTDWGSDTELPNVVTKEQGEEWQIGAYLI